MLTPKRISFLLAATLFVSSLGLIAGTYNGGETSAAPGTLKAKTLRRHDKTKLKPDAAESDLLRRHASAQEEKQEERVVEDKIPKHLPIKVKIRAQKEKAAKDLNNEHWHRDLEIEVKNTGDKPIYYISLILEMPEIKISGDPVTFILRYGQHSVLDDSKGRAAPEDIPLKPGGTCILGLEDQQARGWEIRKEWEKWSPPKKVLIEFEQLNFGDGTGFLGGNGAPWPLPKRGVQDRWPLHGCTSTVAFRSSLPQPTRAPRTAVVTDLTIT
jgi:hypothetical protein